MTNKELQQWEEGNKLIGEFMGYRYSKSGKTMRLNNETSPYRLSDIHYHSSWDWLMSVVEKINATRKYDVVIFRTTCHINDDQDRLFETTWEETKNKTPLIQCVWNAVVQFINWYNSQSKTQPQ